MAQRDGSFSLQHRWGFVGTGNEQLPSDALTTKARSPPRGVFVPGAKDYLNHESRRVFWPRVTPGRPEPESVARGSIRGIYGDISDWSGQRFRVLFRRRSRYRRFTPMMDQGPRTLGSDKRSSSEALLRPPTFNMLSAAAFRPRDRLRRWSAAPAPVSRGAVPQRSKNLWMDADVENRVAPVDGMAAPRSGSRSTKVAL